MTKADRGTDVILFIDDDNKEFLEQARIDTLLKSIVASSRCLLFQAKEQEWKDGKYVDTDKDRVINASEPLWTKKPSELTDEDYLKFYHELMPGNEDPMFWIHLNVDYPFTLPAYYISRKSAPILMCRKTGFSSIAIRCMSQTRLRVLCRSL